MSNNIKDSDNGSGDLTVKTNSVSPVKSLTGIWKCNDGGTYYMHHIQKNDIEKNDTVWWIGTSKKGGDRPWMVVYKGTIHKDGKGENVIDGSWAGIPLDISNISNDIKSALLQKDKMYGEGYGTLRVRIHTDVDRKKVFLKRLPEKDPGERDGFGGSCWELII